MKITLRASQITDAMNLSADGTFYAFFGADHPLLVNCFECSVVSGVK